MPRPRSIDDEEILEAARETFFEHGIQATTAQIAERAGISEGTIFRRFGTKHDLFLAAMDLEDPPEWVDRLEAFDGHRELRAFLSSLGGDIVDFYLEMIPKWNMIDSNIDPGEMLDDPEEAPPVKVLRQLMEFFETQREAGRLGPCDPEVVARMYVGSLFQYAFAETAGVNEVMGLDRELYLEGVVDQLFDGIAPDPSTSTT